MKTEFILRIALLSKSENKKHKNLFCNPSSLGHIKSCHINFKKFWGQGTLQNTDLIISEIKKKKWIVTKPRNPNWVPAAHIFMQHLPDILLLTQKSYWLCDVVLFFNISTMENVIKSWTFVINI